MPRIRTIKPDTWNDEKFGTLKRDARLLFIGLWNFSDDYGTVRSNPIWIKSQIFPYDDDLRIDALTKWLAALVDARMLEPFKYNGEGFYNIRTFLSHQRIEKPSKPIVPIEEKSRLLKYSTTTPVVVADYSPPEIGYSKEEEDDGGGSHTRDPSSSPPESKPKPAADPPQAEPYLSLETNKSIALADRSPNGFVETHFRAGLPPDKLEGWLESFHRQLAYDGVSLKTQKDYRKHFAGWVKFQPYTTGRPEDFSPIKAPMPTKPQQVQTSLKTGIKML